MLKQLNITNFTVFTQATLEFSPGLNVIVGENGTGKTHVLKLAYAVIAVIRKPTYSSRSFVYTEKLINTFRVEKIKNLLKKKINRDKLSKLDFSLKKNFNVSCFFDDPQIDCEFGLDWANEKIIISRIPAKVLTNKSVFIPARELLSIYPGFVSLYEGRYLEFEETYRDTCLLLGEPLLKKPMADLMSVLEEAMGGKVELENGRFYLVTPAQGKLEMPLVAEGLRKLAMLAQLIAVGALEKDGYLFWDEPEANLNPRLVKVVARVILQLAKAGIQIFIATHSYFLLKELDILTIQQPIPTRYFSLLKGEDGVVVESGDSLDELQSIVSLEEELAQFDREQDARHA